MSQLLLSKRKCVIPQRIALKTSKVNNINSGSQSSPMNLIIKSLRPTITTYDNNTISKSNFSTTILGITRNTITLKESLGIIDITEELLNLWIIHHYKLR